MIKCNFKKVNNWTTTTYAPWVLLITQPMDGVTMPAHSCMTAWWGLGKGGHELTHNTPEYLQTCHKINNSVVPYKTDI